MVKNVMIQIYICENQVEKEGYGTECIVWFCLIKTDYEG